MRRFKPAQHIELRGHRRIQLGRRGRAGGQWRQFEVANESFDRPATREQRFHLACDALPLGNESPANLGYMRRKPRRNCARRIGQRTGLLMYQPSKAV